MRIIDIISLAKNPYARPQILSYIHSDDLPAGALVEMPLGKRKELGVVLDSHPIQNFRQEIKRAAFEMKSISRVISIEPILTKQQIQLAMFLGQYYFTSPGLFLKNSIFYSSSKSRAAGRVDKFNNIALNSAPAALHSNNKNKPQKLILTPTISQANLLYSFYLSSSPNIILWHSELTKKQQKENWQKINAGQAKVIIGTRSAVFLPFNNLKEIIIEDAANPAHRSWDARPHYSAIVAAEKLTEIFEAKITVQLPASPSQDGPKLSGLLVCGLKGTANSISAETKFKKKDNIGIRTIDLRAEMKAGNFSIFSRALQTAIKNALVKKQPIILFINRRGSANFILCRDCGYIAKCQNCEAPLAKHLINQKPRLLCHRCGYQENPPSTCPQCESYRVKSVGVGSQKVEAEALKLFSQAHIARLDSDNAPKPKDQQKIIQDYIDGKTDILIATQILFSYKTEIFDRPPSVIGMISADTLLHLPDYQSGERTWQTIAMLKDLQKICHCEPRLSGAWQSRGSGVTRATDIIDSSLIARNDKPVFLIQTHNPENPIIQSAAAGDWQKFYDDEIETRKILNYPPFSQIVKLTFRHRDPKRAGQEAKILAAKLTRLIEERDKKLNIGNDSPPKASAISTTGCPAFIPKQKGKYVWNIIIKFPFNFPAEKSISSAPSFEKDSSFIPPFRKGGLGGIYADSNFFRVRNSLLQYVPTNWEIDVDPIDLL